MAPLVLFPHFTVEKAQGHTANKELSQKVNSGPQTPRLSTPNSLSPEELTSLTPWEVMPTLDLKDSLRAWLGLTFSAIKGYVT